jgi:hypothetical protein
MTPIQAGQEAGHRFFCDRLEFARQEGIPLTLAMLSTFVTGAIGVACGVAVDAERDREIDRKAAVKRWLNQEPEPEPASE